MSEIIENPNLQDENSTIGNKTAVVAIIGRPSVGKSTFLNTASGKKISIVSPVPQTTRNAVKGIINTNLGQLVFIDTPGYHNSEKKFNLKLRSLTKEQLDSCDAILYLTWCKCVFLSHDKNTCSIFAYLHQVGKIVSQQSEPCVFCARLRLRIF